MADRTSRDGGPEVEFASVHQPRRTFERLLERFSKLEITGDLMWNVGGPDQSVAVSLDRMPRLTPE